ncbi:30S ribosomal protein S4e, partial [Candidatus Woesearchaeota archaeon]|nr:30S ribosomal protein S4e [Candidatus Woesearchaeota archaeon]
DVISLPDIGKNYRVLINKKNQIYLKEIDEKEAKFKLCKVVGKTALPGKKLQLNLHDGKNVVAKEQFSAGDTAVFEFGKGITGKIEFKENHIAYLLSGKHVGLYGNIVKVIETKRRRDEIIIKSNSAEIRTAKRYAFVVGKDKPQISLD